MQFKKRFKMRSSWNLVGDCVEQVQEEEFIADHLAFLPPGQVRLPWICCCLGVLQVWVFF